MGLEFLVIDVESPPLLADSWFPYLTGKPLKPTYSLGGLTRFPFECESFKAFLELFVVFEETSPLSTGLLLEEFGVRAEEMSCSISNTFLTILSMNSLSVLLLKLIKKGKTGHFRYIKFTNNQTSISMK